ncbi:trypsin-like peptidase domain-containing protein [Aliikangiella coralliicola]|uniref:Trypsin-like serine protease n=1 Tax=Aliikangiella coralliicola TaxID=2592383 RepID=A0A545UIB7_9GAMM|nr:trypsin-like peptidase domain-containing protein [Aliikangiella coralliicola]TQV89205.1 trypsin-like serine protease [Aliikangiella coralliicola]
MALKVANLLNKLIAILLFIFLIISALPLKALSEQIQQSRLIERPESFTTRQLPELPVNYLQSVNLQQLNKQDKIRAQQNQPFRFAIPIFPQQSKEMSGEWQVVGEMAIWRLNIASTQAKSFNFVLSQLTLPESAQLYFYNKSAQQVLGPYTKDDVAGSQEFWSPLIEASEATIEINVPVSDKPQLNFEVSQINLGYRDWQQASLPDNECHIDVVCSQGDDWRDPIRSVARYTIKGQFLCTGTLVNNTSNDRTPYFLTAKHCEVTPSSAASMIFYWNYQTSSCNGARNGSLTDVQSGAAFRAASEHSDFALVELNKVPPSPFNVHWSGWDRRNSIPDMVASIHHPGGLEKSISLDFGPFSRTQRFSDSNNTNGAYLRVTSWDEGSTAPGSSGSGIWNSQGQLTGTLTGGFASCQAPQESDWYGRMAVHWDANLSQSAQVKAWLDPETTDDLTLAGVDECSPPEVSVTVEPQNIKINEAARFVINNGEDSYLYRWDFNDDGRIDSTSAAPEYTYDYLYKGNLRLKVVAENGCTQTLTRAISVLPPEEEIFPLAGRLSSRWSQSRRADDGWFIDSNSFFEGGLSLKSKPINNSQKAAIELIHNFNHPTDNFISFAVKTSTESGKDKLNFYVDNRLVDSWDGEVPWQLNYYPLEPGLHILSWSYEKDNRNSAGADAVWIDAVSGITQSSSGGGAVNIYSLLLLVCICFVGRKRNKNQLC